MKPTNAESSENIIPVNIACFKLGNSGISPVGHTDSTSDTVASFCKIQTVSDSSADTVIFYPFNQRSVNSALKHKVLNKSADLIICKCRNSRGFKSEATAKSSCDVIFSAALPHSEGTCGSYPSVAGIKS